MENSPPVLAKYLILGGIALVVVGLIYYFFHDKLSWIGNLPGDVKMEGENTKVYFPIVTMIVLSIVFSILLNVFRRFF